MPEEVEEQAIPTTKGKVEDVPDEGYEADSAEEFASESEGVTPVKDLPQVPAEPAQDYDVSEARAAAKAAAAEAKAAEQKKAEAASAVKWTQDDEAMLLGVGRPWKHQKMFMLADTDLFFKTRQDMPDGGATAFDKIRVSAEHTLAKKLELGKPRRKKPVVEVAYIGANNGDDPESWELYKKILEKGGFTAIKRVRSRLPKRDAKYLRKCDLVFIAPGDGPRGWAVMEKTDMANIIWDKWENNDTIVGVGAGASQMAYGIYQQWTKDKYKRLFDRTKRKVAGEENVSESEVENPLLDIPYVTSDSQLSSETDWEPGDETLEERRNRWEKRRLERKEEGTRTVELVVPRAMLAPYSSDSEFSATTRSFRSRGPMEDDQKYYELIGANPTDTAEEVARLSRVAKVRTHPDRNKDDPKATDKFQLVMEAVEVLTDEEKRRMYDQYGMEGVRRLMYAKQDTRGYYDDPQTGEIVPEAKPGMMRWKYNFTYCFRMMPLLVGYHEEEWDWIALKWCLKEIDEVKHGLLAVGLGKGSGLGFSAPTETNGAGIMEPIMHTLRAWIWKRWEDWEAGGTWHESLLLPDTKEIRKDRIINERIKVEAKRPTCRVCGKKGVRTKEEAARSEASGLVRLLRCAKCHEAHYCSRDHQRDDWPKHKAECKKICERKAPPAAPKLKKGFFGAGGLNADHKMDVDDQDSNDPTPPKVFNPEAHARKVEAADDEDDNKPNVSEVLPQDIDKID